MLPPCGYRQKWITWFLWSDELDGLRGRDGWRAMSIDEGGRADGLAPYEDTVEAARHRVAWTS
jgi:hypothetical protein